MFLTVECFSELWGTVRENHMASRRVLEKVGMKAIERVPGAHGAPASLIHIWHAD